MDGTLPQSALSRGGMVDVVVSALAAYYALPRLRWLEDCLQLLRRPGMRGLPRGRSYQQGTPILPALRPWRPLWPDKDEQVSITRYAKKSWLEQRERLRTPEEWMNLKGPVVLDPDGWRFQHGKLMPKDWDEPLTYEEFRERARHSTTMLHDRRPGQRNR